MNFLFKKFFMGFIVIIFFSCKQSNEPVLTYDNKLEFGIGTWDTNNDKLIDFKVVDSAVRGTSVIPVLTFKDILINRTVKIDIYDSLGNKVYERSISGFYGHTFTGTSFKTNSTGKFIGIGTVYKEIKFDAVATGFIYFTW